MSRAQPDPYPLLRSAVATAALGHWRALRKIAPLADPRTVAAEAVASQACSLLQHPALWESIYLLQAIIAGDIRTLEHATVTEHELVQIARQVDALDHAAAAWCASAHGPDRKIEVAPREITDNA